MTDSYLIFLADENLTIRRQLRAIVNEKEGLSVSGEAGTLSELLQSMTSPFPDLVLLGLTLPYSEQIHTVKMIKKASKETKILILSALEEREHVCKLFSTDIEGYLLKREIGYALLDATDSIRQDLKYLSPFLVKKFAAEKISQSDDKKYHPSQDRLTAREVETLTLLSNGLSSKEIAQCLGTSKRTVDNHRASIMKKLKIKGTANLVRYAIRKGYTALP